MEIIELLRIPLGSVFVLFLPGYAWSFVFFKKGEIDLIERIALSFGLSIALVPLVIFWLNWLFTIRINIVNVTAVILGLIICALIIMLIMGRFQKQRREFCDTDVTASDKDDGARIK
jgi:uncharacterized membrane protein